MATYSSYELLKVAQESLADCQTKYLRPSPVAVKTLNIDVCGSLKTSTLDTEMNVTPKYLNDKAAITHCDPKANCEQESCSCTTTFNALMLDNAASTLQGI